MSNRNFLISLSNKKTRNFNDFPTKFKRNSKKNIHAADHKESKEKLGTCGFSDAARKFFALPEITAIIGIVFLEVKNEEIPCFISFKPVFFSPSISSFG